MTEIDAGTPAGPPHEFVGCNLYSGDGEMPPGPEGALVYLACAPGGSLHVREDGYVRLGPGTEIRALEGGGFTITVPGLVAAT
jgi:hypothetical protein